MKLQKKLESSLDDIIKTEKKKPEVSSKSKGITRTGEDRLKRLKQLKKRGPRPDRVDRALPETRKPKFTKRANETSREPGTRPKTQRGKNKWTAPRRGSKFNRKFRGRNRN
jgi:hypothetical protein